MNDREMLEELGFLRGAELEDWAVAFGMDPSELALESVYCQPPPIEQPVSWPTALLVIGMVFLCIILAIGGL